MKKIAVILTMAFLFVFGVTVATASSAHAQDMSGSIIWTEGTTQ